MRLARRGRLSSPFSRMILAQSAGLEPETDDHQVSVVGGRLRRHPLLENLAFLENLSQLTYQRQFLL